MGEDALKDGHLFQTSATATRSARSPNVSCCVRGTISAELEADCRGRPDSTSATCLQIVKELVDARSTLRSTQPFNFSACSRINVYQHANQIRKWYKYHKCLTQDAKQLLVTNDKDGKDIRYSFFPEIKNLQYSYGLMLPFVILLPVLHFGENQCKNIFTENLHLCRIYCGINFFAEIM